MATIPLITGQANINVYDDISVIGANIVPSGHLAADRNTQTFWASNGVTWRQIDKITDVWGGSWLDKLDTIERSADVTDFDNVKAALAAATSNIDLNGKKITTSATPTSANDLVNKTYADSRIGTGQDPKNACLLATTINISNLSGGAPSVVDGVTVPSGARILAWQQSNHIQNGIYVADTPGTGGNGSWSRSTDFDEDSEVTDGAFFPVTSGINWGGLIFYVTSSGNDPIVVGQSHIDFAPLTGPLSEIYDVGGILFGDSAGHPTTSGGNLKYDATNTQLLVPDGTQAKPSISFITEVDTGLYLNSDIVTMVKSGSEHGKWTGSTYTSQKVFRGPVGTAAAPTYSFESDTDTGIFQPQTNAVALVASGTNVLQATGTAITTPVNVQYRTDDSTAAAPAYAFTDNPSMGMYRKTATNTLAFGIGGNEALSLNSNKQVLADLGSQLIPSYTFREDTDLGFYRQGTDSLGFTAAASGVLRMDVNGLYSSHPGSDTIAAIGVAGANGKIDGFFVRNNAVNELGITVGGSEKINLGSSGFRLLANNLGGLTAQHVNFAEDTDTGLGLWANNQLALFAGGAEHIFSQTQYQAKTGSAAAPSLAFETKATTGFYLTSTNQNAIGVTVSGTQYAAFEPAKLRFVNSNVLLNTDGTAAAPSYTFDSDTDTGIYRKAADSLGFTAGGTLRAEVNTTDITTTVPFLTASGTVTAPAYSFTGDTDTGLYRKAADLVALAANGVEVVSFNSDQQILASDANLTIPAYSFLSDSNTGFYKQANGQVGFASDGTLASILGGFGIKSTDGSASAPSYTFINDTNTGLYSKTGDELGVTVSGTLSSVFSQFGLELQEGLTVAGAIQTPTNNSQIATDDRSLAILTPASAVTGITMAAGNRNKQILFLFNRSAFDISFDTTAAVSKISGSNINNILSAGRGTVMLWDTAASPNTWIASYLTSTGGGATTLDKFNAGDGVLPASAPATTGTRNDHKFIAFDPDTDQNVSFESVLPSNYGAGNINVNLWWAANGATTGNVRWDVAFETLVEGVEDLDDINGASAQSATATTASVDGKLTKTTIAFTQAQADGIAANQVYRLRITRDANHASDTMAAPAQLYRVSLTS